MAQEKLSLVPINQGYESEGASSRRSSGSGRSRTSRRSAQGQIVVERAGLAKIDADAKVAKIAAEADAQKA